MTTLIAIDPGTTQSGWVSVETGNGLPKILAAGVDDNRVLLNYLRQRAKEDELVIEMVKSYGASVGDTTFEMVVWIGRFEEVFDQSGRPVRRIPRATVRTKLCGTARAKPPETWQAVLDLYGGEEKAKGCKARPGPLYGITSHMRSALELAIAADKKDFWEE